MTRKPGSVAAARREPPGVGPRICIVASRFNFLVVERLLEGARRTLLESGVEEEKLDVVYVPGAWELPVAARQAAEAGYDAIVALGCVIRGQTAHFDHVSRTAADGLARVQYDTGVPVGMGVLTPDDMRQAMERAGGDAGHAGIQAAEAALAMIAALSDLSARTRRDRE